MLVNIENLSINRNLSAAVLHIKPSCNNSNLWQRTFREIQIYAFPVLPDNKDDRNCTEMNNLLVYSTSLPGKIDCINVKTNDVTMYGRSANL